MLKELKKMANDFDKYNDDENPALMFGLSSSNLLSQIVKGEIDPIEIAKYTLSCRGQDENGDWVGFAKAEKIHFGG